MNWFARVGKSKHLDFWKSPESLKLSRWSVRELDQSRRRNCNEDQYKVFARMQTISNVNSVNKWSTQLSKIKTMQRSLAITSESRTETKSRRVYSLGNLVFCFSKPNQFQDKNTCVSCPVNRCSSRNIPCKRREHILLDRQSSLFVFGSITLPNR